MKIILVTLFIFLNLANPSLAKSNKNKKKKRLMPAKWYRLNKLIKKEIHTIKSLGKLGPKLTYRLLELYSEKLKLIKEKENKTFISSISGTGKLKEKKEYFKESKKLYEYTHKMGKHLVLKYPHFKHKSSIFYTMALNSREYGEGKWTENYLLRALQNSHGERKELYNIKTNLAEHYYNNKEYSKAIYFYKEILNGKGTEWHAKHHYNAAWSYLKLKNLNKALHHLHRSYHFSQKKNYVSVEDQVLNSIGLFYVYQGDIKKGVNFYIKNVKEPASYLVTMSKKAADKLGNIKSEYILLKALNNAQIKKQLLEEILVRTALLENYRTFKQFDKFYANSLKIYKINKIKKFPEEFLLSSIEKIKSLVGYLQLRLSNNMKKNNTNYKKNELDQVINFFKILAGLDPKNTDEYRFFQGETYFSISKFKLASKKYVHALNFSIQKKKKNWPSSLQKKIFNSLFATLEEGDLPKALHEKYTIYSYQNHLKIWPIDEKSRVIYSKLFNIHLKNKKLDPALLTLTNYSKNYKADLIKQRAMLSSIIDIHVKNKNPTKIAYWISKLEAGFLKFPKKYITKATNILSTILFNNLQKIEDSGDEKKATIGYLALFNNKKYPKTIKAKSSFKLAIIELKKGKRKSSYKWFKVSMKLQTDKELKENLNTVFAIQESYFKQQDFRRSIAVSKNIIKRFCNIKFHEKNDMIKNIIHFSLLENNYTYIEKNFSMVSKCSQSKEINNKLMVNIVSHFKNHRLYNHYFKFVDKNHKNPILLGVIKDDLLTFYWDELELNRSDELKEITKRLQKDNSTNKNPEYLIIAEFEKWKNETNSKQYVFSKNKKFDENTFNSELEENLKKLKVVSDQAVNLLKSTTPQIILPTYKTIINSYHKLASAIGDYTPQGVPQEFVKGFKSQMLSLKNNLINQSQKYHNSAIKMIQNEKLLTSKNNLFINNTNLSQKYNFRYPSSFYAATIDITKGNQQ